jgi:L-arabinose transport system ATP-binding protein
MLEISVIGACAAKAKIMIFGAASRESAKFFRQWSSDSSKIQPQRFAHGICPSPEDRKEEGIISGTFCEENNISCRRHFLRAGLFLNKRKERENTNHLIANPGGQKHYAQPLICKLSVFNQQKPF